MKSLLRDPVRLRLASVEEIAAAMDAAAMDAAYEAASNSCSPVSPSGLERGCSMSKNQTNTGDRNPAEGASSGGRPHQR